MLKGYAQYTQAYQKAQVNTVDQRKLIVMLYDGAIRFLTQAVDKLRAGDQFEAHNNLIRGKSIIAELLASLNMEQGGDIAKNLQRLYSYMFNELIDANLKKDRARIDHVLNLLRELRVGWQGVKTAPEAPKAGAGPAPGMGGPAKRITVKG